MTLLRTLLLFAALLGPAVSAQSSTDEPAPPNNRPCDGPANVDDLARCSSSIREVKALMMSRISGLQKALALQKAELAAMRRAHEMGLQDLKTALLAQLRRGQAVTPSPLATEIVEGQAAANSKLRSDVMSGLGRLSKRLDDLDRARPNASCTAAKRLVRRAGAQACSGMAAAVIANLTRPASPDPDRQRRRASATDARQAVALSRLLPLLGYQNATNVSVNRVLSELSACAEAKQIAQLYDLERTFSEVATRDLDVASSGENIGLYLPRACGLQCLLRISCTGFYVSDTGRCIVFTAATGNKGWSEQERENVTVWVRRGGVCTSQCKLQHYPYSLGRSRYRIGNKPKMWPAARKECEKFGGKLVQISSQRERRFVHQLLKTHGTVSRYYIGLYQVSVATNPAEMWFWFPSFDRFDASHNWISGQPDDQNGQQDRCVMDKSNGLYRDLPKTESNGFVCECFVV